MTDERSSRPTPVLSEDRIADLLENIALASLRGVDPGPMTGTGLRSQELMWLLIEVRSLRMMVHDLINAVPD